MENDRDSVYLKHIQDSTKKIQRYVKGVSEEKFKESDLIQDAVIRQLEIIGEAVKNLSVSFRKQKNHIPWKDIAGMRDKLIHHYIGVDVDAVWITVSRDIPTLKKEIEAVLKDIKHL